MKILLDENLHVNLKRDFTGHEVITVADKNWKGKKNGELLKLMTEENFDLLITFDKHLEAQQNLEKFSVPVILLRANDNTYATSRKFIPMIEKLISEGLSPGVHEL